jgi:hypothetical protein
MAPHADTVRNDRLVFPPWARKLPLILIVAGALVALIAAAVNVRQFAYSYLLAYMFFLSICLGGLFLVIIHHLFDASWSVPVRRITEHLAFLLPVMAVLFIPIAMLAPNTLYPWLIEWVKGGADADHALAAKQPMFSLPWFYIIAALLFLIWWWLSAGLRKWSLRQDQTGDPRCTYMMRRYAAGGIYLFALTLTLAAIMWMKSIEHQWFSTMYGVYYFAASVWVTLATVYFITMMLHRTGPLAGVVGTRQFHDIGVLLFAFTVFYAYIAFSQYFLIWNAAMPEETFWYVKREQGSWWDISMLLIFGHFALPFLSLLRIDAKLWLPLMVPMCGWTWMMHFADMSFNIMPVLHDKNFVLHWADLGCMAFIGGVLSLVFLKYYFSHAPYPLKDPRLAEALGVYHHAGETSVAPPQEKVRPA